MTKTKAPKQMPPTRMNVVELYKTSPLALVGTFMAAITNSTFYSMAPLFTHDIGFSLQQTAYFMSAAVLGGLILQLPVGKLSDKFDRRWVLSAVSLLVSLVSAIIYFLSVDNAQAIIIMAACYGSLAFLVYSISAAHANDFTSKDKMVQTASSLLVTYGLGAIIGPILSSMIMGYFGTDKLFLWLSCLSIFLCIYAIYRSTKRKSVGDNEKSEFVAVAANHTATKQLLVSEIVDKIETKESSENQ